MHACVVLSPPTCFSTPLVGLLESSNVWGIIFLQLLTISITFFYIAWVCVLKDTHSFPNLRVIPNCYIHMYTYRHTEGNRLCTSQSPTICYICLIMSQAYLLFRVQIHKYIFLHGLVEKHKTANSTTTHRFAHFWGDGMCGHRIERTHLCKHAPTQVHYIHTLHTYITYIHMSLRESISINKWPGVCPEFALDHFVEKYSWVVFLFVIHKSNERKNKCVPQVAAWVSPDTPIFLHQKIFIFIFLREGEFATLCRVCHQPASNLDQKIPPQPIPAGSTCRLFFTPCRPPHLLLRLWPLPPLPSMCGTSVYFRVSTPQTHFR